jgi:hypothetical protein
VKSSRSRGSWLRYATGIGRTDWHALRECFTQDVHADYDTIGVFDGAEAITAVMEKTHTGMGPTFLRMSNVVVDVDVDGDRASAHTYVHAIVMVNPTSKETCRRGRVVRRPADQDHRWLAHHGARLANRLPPQVGRPRRHGRTKEEQSPGVDDARIRGQRMLMEPERAPSRGDSTPLCRIERP